MQYKISLSQKKSELIKRIELLRRGILPPTHNGKPIETFLSAGTGAGPQGKTFKVFVPGENVYSQMISVPVYDFNHLLAPYAYSCKTGNSPGTLITENGIQLKSVSIPKFLTASLENGTPLSRKGIIMRHCYDTFTSVFAYKCKHYEKKEQCKYCEIEQVGLGISNFPEIQDIKEFAETVQIVTSKDNVRSLTITTGTFDTNDNVLRKYIDLVRAIRERSGISIHLQFEPVDDLSLIKEVAKYVQSVGIFLEIYDDEIRKLICPGKFHNSRDKYKRNWAEAAKHFKKGSVTTTCLLGFGEEFDNIIKSAEEFANVGASTTLLFIRSNNDYMQKRIPSYLNSSIEELVNLHLQVASILNNNGIGFGSTDAAGCAGCHGCNAMKEACEIASEVNVIS